MVLSRVQLIRVRLVLVNLNPINDTYILNIKNDNAPRPVKVLGLVETFFLYKNATTSLVVVKVIINVWTILRPTFDSFYSSSSQQSRFNSGTVSKHLPPSGNTLQVAIESYQRRPSSSISREETRRIFRRSVA